MRPTQKSLRTFRSADVKRYVLKNGKESCGDETMPCLSRKKIGTSWRNVALVVGARNKESIKEGMETLIEECVNELDW